MEIDRRAGVPAVVEVRCEDADDAEALGDSRTGLWLGAQQPADRARTRGKSIPPERVTEEGDRLGACGEIGCRQPPPGDDRDPQAVAEPLRHPQSPQHHRVAVVARIERFARRGNRVFDDVLHRGPVQVGHATRFPGARRRVTDVVQPIDREVWQRAQQVGVDHRDNGGGQREAERQRQDDDDREDGRAPQAARREPEIAHQAVEPAPSPYIAGAFPQLQRVAESRRLSHHRAVGDHLFLERRFQAPAVEEIDDSPEPLADARHQFLLQQSTPQECPLATNRPSARTNRRHAVSSTRINRGGHASIVGTFQIELLLPGRRQAVLAHRAPGLGHRGRCLDPALEQQLLERRIERTFLDAQLFPGQGVNALGNGVAVQRPGGEHPQHEHDQGAGRQTVFARHS